MNGVFIINLLFILFGFLAIISGLTGIIKNINYIKIGELRPWIFIPKWKILRLGGRMQINRLNKELGLTEFTYPTIKQQIYMKMSGNPPVIEMGKVNFYGRVISYLIVQIVAIIIGIFILYNSFKAL